MTDLLQGSVEVTVTINDVRNHAISHVLADIDTRYGIALIGDIVLERVAAEMDRHRSDFDILAFDIMGKGDSLEWDVELSWWIACDECVYQAVKQDEFAADLCRVHFHDALEDKGADLANDDAWLNERGLL